MTQVDHSRMANAIRGLAMDAVEKAKSGHPGLPMGAADIATVLFTQFEKLDPDDPRWPDRDRFILSAGHGSMLLYALLYLTGNADMTLDEIKNFRQLGSRTPGHPENFITSGVETTTGPLGQGVASSVGMALAERLLAAEFGEDIVDHHTYVLCSDGDLMEGVSHEALALAGHYRLSKLIFLYDDNGITIDGPISLTDSVDQVARFKAHGWNSVQIDGHDQKAIAEAIRQAQLSDRPSMIACKTTIGFGAPTKAGTSKAHGEPLGAEELAGAKKALGWNYGPFEVPDDVLQAWRNVGKQGASAHADWRRRFEAKPDALRSEFVRRVIDRKRPQGLADAIRKLKDKLVADPPTIATRKASEMALEVLVAEMPELLLGSADLTPSNNTRTKGLKEVTPDDFSGRYIHYGIREMGMAAAMNGISIHGGYELVAAQQAKVSLYASGSEVEIAVAAQKELAARGIATRVVSVPSLELLLAQPADRRNAIVGDAPVKIAIEAAVRFGWDAVIGPDGIFVGMSTFGASAPAKALYKHFGITAEAVVEAATKRLQSA